MSLVGFAARNHPQQTATDEVDDRAITMADFAPLHERFRFTIDAAAAAHNARLPRFWTRADDALAQSWQGERVWCNPPYSDIRPWVEKAQREWDTRYRFPAHPGVACTGCRYCEHDAQRVDDMAIVMLLPANRTEQGWWQDLVEPQLRAGALRVEFLRGRMRFDRPNAVIGPKGDRPPFGCCLLIWTTEGASS